METIPRENDEEAHYSTMRNTHTCFKYFKSAPAVIQWDGVCIERHSFSSAGFETACMEFSTPAHMTAIGMADTSAALPVITVIWRLSFAPIMRTSY
jgi:hypothetical protein